MLDREQMIRRLTQGKDDDHEKLFALRKKLRGMNLPALAERYRGELEDDPYNPSKEDPFLCSTEQINQ